MQSEAQRAATTKGRQIALAVIADQTELRDHLLLEAIRFGASRKNICRLFGLGSERALATAAWRARKRQAQDQKQETPA